MFVKKSKFIIQDQEILTTSIKSENLTNQTVDSDLDVGNNIIQPLKDHVPKVEKLVRAGVV